MVFKGDLARLGDSSPLKGNTSLLFLLTSKALTYTKGNMDIPKLPKGHITDELIEPRSQLSEDSLKSMLRSMNLKVTLQRLSILKILNKGPKSHITAKDAFEKVRKEHPHIGFATVYRFLKDTARFGITSELRIGHLPARYELKVRKHHHHIVCTHCEKVVEFQNEPIEAQIQKISEQYGFLMEHHIFELYGTCSNCQLKKSNQ